MRFDRLDLNLLVAFDALMRERSVSLAAERLNLSQSAMSGSLRRLREFFKDPLFVQVGREMMPTTRAFDLSDNVQHVLFHIRSTITTPHEFDPLTAKREFSIMASDYVYDVILSDVLKTISRTSPDITFRLYNPSPQVMLAFERGEIDLLITLEEFLSQDHPARPLFEDSLRVICWNGNRQLGDEITREQFETLPHVEVAFGPDRHLSFCERELAEFKLKRRIDIRLSTFSAVPQQLVGTDRISVMNGHHAAYFASLFPLKHMALPLETKLLCEFIQWNSMRKTDQGVLWFRDRLVESCADLQPF
ncbi:MAG: LysR family transcriptional regulator [Hydrogenophaga sp.]|nr:LysR family transcriptional regulator [Hydrogenophaga sp.]